MSPTTYMAIEIRALNSTWTAISDDRSIVWRAIAESIEPANDQVLSLSPEHTLFVPPNVYERGTAKISGHVAETMQKWMGTHSKLDLLIIDVSANQYEDLPDTLMYHVMSGVATSAADRGIQIDQIVLLYPQHGPRVDAPFLQLLRNYQYHVISQQNTFLHPKDASEDSTSDAFVEYPEPPFWHKSISSRVARLGTPEELKARLIQRIGHFERIDCDPPMCSKYFWDGSRATGLIADMLVDKAGNVGVFSPDVIAYYAPLSHWIEETAMLVASKLNVSEIINVEHMPKEQDYSGKSVLLIVDLVHHGHSCSEAIDILSKHGMEVGRSILSVMLEIKSAGLIEYHDKEYRIKHLLKVNIDESLQADCEQCSWGLQPVSPRQEESRFIGPYDMWQHVFNSYPWVGESDKPKPTSGRMGFERTPDLQRAINTHGKWFALKFFGLLEGAEQSTNVTLIGPDEPGTKLLASRIKSLSTGTITTVLLPRRAIERVAGSQDVERKILKPARREQNHWVRRLDHLSRVNERVILIDEFNASGHTALALVKLMNAISVPIEFYFCIWDRCPSAFVGRGITAHSLYRFESPRSRSG